MSARYLLRFDDVNAGSDWDRWDRIESRMDRESCRPIVAVVPANADPELVVSVRDEDRLWESVSRWQSKGWSVGLHGYEHVDLSGHSGIAGWGGLSEFAGVDKFEQARRIDAGLAVFHSHNVNADVWIAPAHSFDAVTLELIRDRGLEVVSDGYYVWPGRDQDGVLWVPQQLWDFRWRPLGVWTVCFHPDRWSMDDEHSFTSKLARYSANVVDLSSVVAEFHIRRMTQIDRAMWRTVRSGIVARHLIGKAVSRVRVSG